MLLCSAFFAVRQDAPALPPAHATPLLPPAAVKATKEKQPVNAALVQADNRFGLDLLRNLSKSDAKANVFLSPSSLALALQMTYNGAGGTTQAAMANTLHLDTLSLDAVNQGNATLLASMTEPEPNVTLHIANSLWLRSSLTPNADFVQRNTKFYGATLGDLSGGAQAVNRWVNTQTSGKIPAIVTEQQAAQAGGLLANAVYFKGAWSRPFREHDTTPDKFAPMDGAAFDCKMMHRTDRFDYTENAEMQVVHLPYGRGTTEMVLLLPRKGKDFAAFVARLTPASFDSKNAPQQAVHLGLPRFKTEFSANLNAPLTALGMGAAFGGKADFTKMFASGGFYINAVLHKTFLRVDENGTEAAAATAVMMTRSALPPPANPAEMLLNRPFVCAIRDAQSGALLFVGAIVHPEPAQ